MDEDRCAQCGLPWDDHPFLDVFQDRVCRLVTPEPVRRAQDFFCDHVDLEAVPRPSRSPEAPHGLLYFFRCLGCGLVLGPEART